MRLRLGRGLRRHNLQPVMDFEDFVFNRTNGKPASIFKTLGDAAKQYCSIVDNTTIWCSNIPLLLRPDLIETVLGLELRMIAGLCSKSIFSKSKHYEVIQSDLISTVVSSTTNTIHGETREARIHDQIITWGNDSNPDLGSVPFNLNFLQVLCGCRFHLKLRTTGPGFCTHIIGQLRRTVFLMSR